METDKIRIRSAGGDENLERFRSWLPQAFLSLPRPVFFLAEREEGGEAVGMGSLRLLETRGEVAGRFQLFVLPEFRRKGIGGRLMRAMIDHGGIAGGDTMLAGVPVAGSGEESRFFESLDGFGIARTLYKFAVKTEVAWGILDPMVSRLEKKGGVLQGYEIVPLDRADRGRVYQFVLRNLGGIPDSLARALRGGPHGFLSKLSVVVRTAEGPAAVLLIRRNERGLVVDSRVVAPKHRRIWMNAVLMHTFIKEARSMGVEEVYFEGDDQLHEETITMARRGARVLEANYLYGCDLKGGEEGKG